MLNENSPFFLYSADLPMQAALRMYTPRVAEAPTSPLYPLKKGSPQSPKKEPEAANSRAEQKSTLDSTSPENRETNKIPHKEADST